MSEKEIKKKLKAIVSETYTWVDDPKGRDDFQVDLDITYDEMGKLKDPIMEEFGITIRKREIKSCDDINELTALIYEKMSAPSIGLSGSTTHSAGNGTLFDDLNAMADEFYTREDLIGGLKIIKKMAQEIGGAAGLFIVVGKLLTVISAGLLAPIGLSIAGTQIARFQLMAVKAYTESNAAERKQIRAAVSYIKGGFSLAGRLK